MAAYPAEVETEAPTEQSSFALPRQRGAALGLAAMAVGASSVIGLAGTALAADHETRGEHGGAAGSLYFDEHAHASAHASDASDASDAGTALLDRIRSQGTPEEAVHAADVRREAAAAASAKAAAAERARSTGPVVAPIACATSLGRAASYWSHLHPGQDFPAPAGSAVRAVGAGSVTSAGWAGSYGYRVVETLHDGTEIWYCHLSAITVGHGPLIPGQPLGRVGSTRGHASPHVYVEIRPDGGDPVEPAAWFAAHGLSL